MANYDLELYQTIVANPPFSIMESAIHGKAHAERVFLFATLLAGSAPNPRLDMNAIMMGALLHDCGRLKEGYDPEHAERSADLVMRFIRDLRIRNCDTLLVSKIIKLHYNPGTNPLLGSPMEAKIVGDADKLDRFRLGGDDPCDKSYFELPYTFVFMELSKRLNHYVSP